MGQMQKKHKISVISHLKIRMKLLVISFSVIFETFLLNFLFAIPVSKGQAPSAPPDFVPILKQSVCYVVMAVIINDKNEILMMQEAKSSCAGQWYLPAGRVEPNESLTVVIKDKFIQFRLD